MLSGTKELVSIALGQETLKVILLKDSPDVPAVGDIIKKDVRDVPEDELPKVVRTALDGLGVKKGRAVCVLPSHVVTTKNIEIPSVDPVEIKSIIDLQAGRHTPFAREEILVGYITIGVFQRNYTKVLLVIVNREVVKRHLAVLEQAGLSIEQVVFAPEAMAQFYARHLAVKDEDPPVGIIDVDFGHTNFIVEFNRTVATSRDIAVGMGHLVKEGASAKEKLVAEILKSVEAYQSEDINKMPEVYYLTSDDAKVKDLQPLLQERLKANVKVMPYLDRIKAAQPVMLKFVTEFGDDSFLDTVATGQGFTQIQVDLTPEEVRMKRSLEEKGKQVVTAGILGILFLLLVCLFFFSKIYFKSSVLGRLDKQYSDVHKERVALDRVAEKTQIIKDYMRGRMASLDVINEIYNVIPDEIYIQSVAMDEKGGVNIQGISESTSRIFEFNKALEDSKFFKGVKTKSTAAKKDRGKDAAAFEIGFKLESAQDEDEKKAPAAGQADAGGEADGQATEDAEKK